MEPNTWWLASDTLEGKSLVFGRGFDYNGMILLDGDNLVIRIPDREQYAYPEVIELVVPIAQVRELIK